MRAWSGVALVAFGLASCGGGSAQSTDAATDSAGAAGSSAPGGAGGGAGQPVAGAGGTGGQSATGGAGGGGGQRAAGGAAGSAPISGLTIWLDAARGIDSDATRWADLSGNGADATPSSASIGLGEDPFVPGRPAIYFSIIGSGTGIRGAQLFVTPGPGTDWGDAPFLLEVVVRHQTAGAGVASFWASGSADTPPDLRLLGNEAFTVNANFAVIAQGPSMTTRLTTGSAVTYNDNSIHSFGVWRDADNNISLLLDGVTVMSGRQTEAVTSSGAATMGPFQGQLFEVLGKKGLVTSEEVAAVESYFKNKYGTP
jgi:hypothetical protein